MSVRVMASVWQLQLPDSQKIVLLALADCANDEGHCWPSMRTLAAKCSKGERTVQGVIKQLVDDGHLTRREVPGKGCNYTVHPRSNRTPAEDAPPPAKAAPHPRSGCGQTIKEPSKNRKSDAGKPACRPENVSEQVWRDFQALRTRKRAPLTETALSGIEREASAAGWPLEDALAECVTRGWQAFKADWVEARRTASTASDPDAGKLFAMHRDGRLTSEQFDQARAARKCGSGPPRPLGEVLQEMGLGP